MLAAEPPNMSCSPLPHARQILSPMMLFPATISCNLTTMPTLIAHSGNICPMIHVFRTCPNRRWHNPAFAICLDGCPLPGSWLRELFQHISEARLLGLEQNDQDDDHPA